MILIAVFTFIKLNLACAIGSQQVMYTDIEISDSVLKQQYQKALEYYKISEIEKGLELFYKLTFSTPANSQLHLNAKIKIAEGFRVIGENEKGIDLLYEVLKEPALDMYNKAYAYNRMAALYNEIRISGVAKRDSALRYSELCLEVARENNYRSYLAISQNELSYLYRRRGETDKAIEFAKQAYNLFLELGEKGNAINTAINLAGSYINKKEYNKGLKMMNNLDSLLVTIDDKSLEARVLMRKSDFYLFLGDYKKAFEKMNKARGLQEKIYISRLDKSILDMSAKYDLQQKENQIKHALQQSKINQQRVLFFLLFTILLIIALVIVLYNFRLKRKIQKKDEELMLQENEQLKVELNYKTKELENRSKELGKVISDTILFNEILVKIKDAISCDKTKEALELIRHNQNLEQNWNKFRLHFDEVYPEFISKLRQKFPQLTENDQRICAFLLMDMKTTEIARLSGVSESSVSKSRNRLRKKIGLTSGEDLNQFLKKIV